MAYYDYEKESPEAPRSKQKETKGESNWAVLALLGLTVLGSLFFWARREFPQRFKGLLGPATLFSTQVSSEFNPEPVSSEIQLLINKLEGRYGVYIYRFVDKEEYGLNQNQVFRAASLDKLPVMIALYREAEAGNIELNDDLQGLAGRMGKSSDNAAKASLVDLLGEEKIQQTIKDLGMDKTSFAENETTPADVGLLFDKLYQGDIVSDEHRNRILEFLTETAFEDRLPAGVPAGVRVVHKVGTEQGSFSDAGIVFAKNPYILVIMSDEALEAEAEEALPQISRIVWEAEGK